MKHFLSFSRQLAFAVTVLAVIGFFGLATPAFAQNASGLQIEPSILEDKINPGETYTSALRATNLSQDDNEYFFVVRDIDGVSETGTPQFIPGAEQSGFDLASWVIFLDDSVVIPAGETREVPFQVRIPRDVSPGGHYGAIFLSLVSPEAEAQGVGAAVNYEVGMIMNLQVSGEIVEEAQIRELSTDKKFYNEGDIDFAIRVENLGNTLLRPRGTIEIFDGFGKLVTTLDVNDAGAGILSEADRVFEAEWQSEGFALGKYTARLGLSYGDVVDRTITREISFWILPWNVLGPVIGVIVAIIIIIWVFIRISIRRKVRRLKRRPRRRPPTA